MNHVSATPKPRSEKTFLRRSFIKLPCQRSRLLGTGSLPAWNRRAGRQSKLRWSPLFICRTSASSENASCCYLSFFYQVFVFSAVCTRLFHHGVSVCLQGNQFLHVAVACCSARRPSTFGDKRPCQLMPSQAHASVLAIASSSCTLISSPPERKSKPRLLFNVHGFCSKFTKYICVHL